jgi:hypothetical protein
MEQAPPIHAKAAGRVSDIAARWCGPVSHRKMAKVASRGRLSTRFRSRDGWRAPVSDSVLEALARALQLDQAERQHLDWDTVARDMVGALRTQAGRNPTDRSLSDLAGELTTRSDGFAAR